MQSQWEEKGGHVSTEEETAVMWSQASQCWWLLVAGKGKKWILPWNLQREPGLADQ